MNKRGLLLFLSGALFVLTFFLSCAPVKAYDRVEEFEVTKDAKVKAEEPDLNFGTINTVRMWVTPGDNQNGFICFDVDSVIGIPFTSAMLNIYICESTVTVIQVFPVAQPWTEDNITWNNAPSYYPDISCSQDVPIVSGFIKINVTSIVENWVSLNFPNLGFCLKTTINGVKFYSKEESNAARHPFLEISLPTPDYAGFSVVGYEISIVFLGIMGVTFFLLCRNRRKTKREKFIEL